MPDVPIVSTRRLGALTAVLLTGAACWSLLWAVAQAPDQTARVKANQADRLAAEALPNAAKLRSDHPPQAVCASGLAPAAALLRGRISEAATAAGVEVQGLDLTETLADPPDLSRLTIDLTISGPYASGLNFAKILADGTPTLFVDELDIAPSQGDTVQWRLSGQLFCAIRLTP